MSRKIDLQIVDDISECDAAGAGSYWTRKKDGPRAGLHFRCPCGCGILAGIEFNKWDWDQETLTASPSININQGHWHGFLKNGEFRSI